MAGVHSALAPASTRMAGGPSMRGIGVAMQGRATPRRRPIRRRADAIVAPVLPALTMAEALPSRTSSAERTSDESFLRRTPWAGSSSMAITSVQATRSRPNGSPTSAGGPTSTTGMPSSAARRAPATISPGARSPPMASTATGRWPSAGEGALPLGLKSVDLDGGSPLVPATGRADHVRGLHLGAVRADAPGRRLQHPVGGLAAAALGLGRLLLRDSHGRAPDRCAGGRAPPLRPGRGPPGLAARRNLRRAEHVEVSPPGVDRLHAVAAGLVAIAPAVLAQAEAVRPTQRGERQLGEERVEQHRLEVDQVVLDPVGVLVAGPPRGRLVAEALSHRHVQLAGDRHGAARAEPLPGGLDGAGDHDAAEVGLEGEPAEDLGARRDPAVGRPERDDDLGGLEG